jgi:hypothetical protein
MASMPSLPSRPAECRACAVLVWSRDRRRTWQSKRRLGAIGGRYQQPPIRSPSQKAVGRVQQTDAMTVTPGPVVSSEGSGTLNRSATMVGFDHYHGARGSGSETQQTERRLPVSKKNVHTVPHEDGWANRREGADRVSKMFPTKDAAERAGRDTARREGVEHLIHNKDGRISERNSYGNDPFPPRG